MLRRLLNILFITFILSCSKDEQQNKTEIDNQIDLVEEFSDWSPEFLNQTSSFEQTRTGTKGTEEKRTIDVSINSNDNETFEGIDNVDINQDGDNFDFYNANLTTYTASEGLGSFSILTNSSSVTYNVDISIKNDGSVSANFDTTSNERKLSLNAAASSDHKFLGWDGPSMNKPRSNNPLVVSIDSDKQFKANFLSKINPDYSGIGFFADSIYSQINPDNLYSYLDVFIQDAQRNGIDLSYVYEGCYSLRFAPPSVVNFEFAGYATRQCYDNSLLITINEDYWKNQLEISPNFSEPYASGFHLMYHELAHDILDLNHTCNETPNFLNHPAGCNGNEINLKYTSDMLWFTENELQEENLGFHKSVYNLFNIINQDQEKWYTSLDWSNSTEENSIPCPLPDQWTDWNGNERGLLSIPQEQLCSFAN